MVDKSEKEELILALTEILPILRAAIGISQGELADYIGVSRQTYSALEIGKRQMSWNTFLSLFLLSLIHILTDRNEYEILAVFKTVVYTDSPEAFKYYRFTDAKSAEEFAAYVKKCKELSLYDTGVSAEYGDKLITLSTCEYSRTNGRLVVVAKKVTESSGANAPANDGAAEMPS